MKKNIIKSLKIIVLGFLITIGAGYIMAWGPTILPVPNGNIETLNTSTVGQLKQVQSDGNILGFSGGFLARNGITLEGGDVIATYDWVGSSTNTFTADADTNFNQNTSISNANTTKQIDLSNTNLAYLKTGQPGIVKLCVDSAGNVSTCDICPSSISLYASTTWSVPPCAKQLTVKLWGGGGGGGFGAPTGDGNDGSATGGGGGGGGYLSQTIMPPFASSYVVNIGNSGTPGGDGGATSFGSISVTGGKAGGDSTYYGGGVGGSGGPGNSVGLGNGGDGALRASPMAKGTKGKGYGYSSLSSTDYGDGGEGSGTSWFDSTTGSITVTGTYPGSPAVQGKVELSWQ